MSEILPSALSSFAPTFIETVEMWRKICHLIAKKPMKPAKLNPERKMDISSDDPRVLFQNINATGPNTNDSTRTSDESPQSQQTKRQTSDNTNWQNKLNAVKQEEQLMVEKEQTLRFSAYEKAKQNLTIFGFVIGLRDLEFDEKDTCVLAVGDYP